MTNPEITHYSHPGHPCPPRQNVLAIVSLVAAFFVPIAAIVTGHLALNQIARTSEEGYGMAKAGLILGYVLTGLQLFLVIIWFGLFFGITSGLLYRG